MGNTGIKIFIVVLGFLWIPTAGLSLPNCPSNQTERYHNCFGTYIWDNGDKYVGEWQGDKQHGYGTYTYGPRSKWAGDRYVGQYRDNKKYGQGFYVGKMAVLIFVFMLITMIQIAPVLTYMTLLQI